MGRSGFVQDVGQAICLLARAPLFAAGTVTVLALGVGANAAVWSIVHTTLLRELPYHQPEQIVMVWQALDRPENWRQGTTGRTVRLWRERSHEVFTGLAAMQTWEGNLSAQLDIVLADRAERLRGSIVTPEFFEVLGVQAAIGRVFGSADEAAGARDLVVLSDRVWLRAFGGDPKIVGREVSLTAGRARRAPRTFTVVGVLSPAFRFTYPLETEVWVYEPWLNVPTDGGAITQNGAIARLKPGVSAEAAASALATFRDEIFPERPNQDPQYRSLTRVQPITEYVVGDTRASLLLIGSVALLLLAMTCATVAGALFVRAASRRADLAVRAALGASTGRLVRQLVVEGAVLAFAGTVAGTLVASAALPIVRALVPDAIPRGDELRVDASWLLFGVATTSIVTVLASLAPAWSGARVDVADALKRVTKSTSPDRHATRWRQALVALQAAMATSLLIGAALLLTSFWRLTHVPLGFRSDRVLTMETRLLDARYQDRDVLRQFQDDLMERVLALPGVVDAGLTSAVPFQGVDFVYSLTAVGSDSRTAGNARMVDDGYFRVMGIELLRGRLFDRQDSATGDRVIVISRAFADAMFGTIDAIGRDIDVRGGPARVIGVVADVRYVAHDVEPYRAVYLPRTQHPNELVCVVAQLAPGAGDPTAALRQAVREVDPAIPLVSVRRLDRILDDALAERRFYTTGTTIFAALALTLTTLGLVVVVTRAVIERRREIAIRTALGATAARITALIARQSLLPVAAGILTGVAAAALASRLLTAFLFQVEPRSAVVFAGATAVVALAAITAAVLPAHAAAKASPAAALKTDV